VLSFVITSIFSGCLSLKCFELGLWIVQLSVSINDFIVVNEKLESLRKTSLGPVPFSQWGHDGWSLSNEAWVFALAFQIFTDKFVNKSGCCPWCFALNILSNTEIVEEFSCFIGVKLVIRWEFIIFENVKILKRFHHWHSSPWS
jgi:hypothetical protein